jgi:hypothetical protein
VRLSLLDPLLRSPPSFDFCASPKRQLTGIFHFPRSFFDLFVFPLAFLPFPSSNSSSTPSIITKHLFPPLLRSVLPLESDLLSLFSPSSSSSRHELRRPSEALFRRASHAQTMLEQSKVEEKGIGGWRYGGVLSTATKVERSEERKKRENRPSF